MKFRIFYLLLLVMIFSCEKEEELLPEREQRELLVGNWINPIQDGNQITFTKSNDLIENKYGISFELFEDKGEEQPINFSSYIERSTEYLATPPLTFTDNTFVYSIEEGTIKLLQSKLTNTLNIPDWQDIWIIKSISETKLVVDVEYSKHEKDPEQVKDHEALMELFKEIETLAYSITCEDGGDWLFTPYGSNSCGGAKGYLPYSNQINASEFLEKVEEYKTTEEEYNTKWGIVSTCDVIPEPKDVVCENGNLRLIYE